ncbi:MAG TPA: hypothetical protein VM537_06895 [Anaerolineae bacterium]|nr:hypothetical protein [Anaerolineae bacterium]
MMTPTEALNTVLQAAQMAPLPLQAHMKVSEAATALQALVTRERADNIVQHAPPVEE